MTMSNKTKQAKWYYGGLSSGIGAGITHPLDLVKVHLQTNLESGKKTGIFSVGRDIVRKEGLLSLYNGLSASLLRQVTYSLPRFGIYEVYKNSKTTEIKFHERIFMAGLGGLIGGICGQPADLVNVRMQNDIKLPRDQRRNYKNCFDAIIRISKTEGVKTLYNGVSMMAPRSCLMTVGQAVGYDIFKDLFVSFGMSGDNKATHLLSGIGAASCATLLTQPFDVVKTNLQNSQYSSFKHILGDIYNSKPSPFGMFGFWKGFLPALIRIGPHTMILFMIKEQLIYHFE